MVVEAEHQILSEMQKDHIRVGIEEMFTKGYNNIVVVGISPAGICSCVEVNFPIAMIGALEKTKADILQTIQQL